MERPSAKRFKHDSDTVVCGCIHNVSPVKMSLKNVGYFNFIIQTDEAEYHNGVVYCADKHERFSQAAATKTPVKLRGVKRVFGFGNQERYDVECSSATRMQITEVKFHPEDLLSKEKLTVADIKKLPRNNKITFLDVKIVKVKLAEILDVRDHVLQMCDGYGCDPTGMVKITFWESAIEKVEKGCSYRLSNLTTRMFAGKVTLSTRDDTEVEKIDDIEVNSDFSAVFSDDDDDDDGDTTSVIKCRVRGVLVEQMWRCAQCNKLQRKFDVKASANCCTFCRKLQRSTSFTVYNRGVLVVSSGLTLSVPNEVIHQYLEKQQLKHLEVDSDGLENHFLLNEEFELTVRNSQVVEMRMLQGEPSVDKDETNPNSDLEMASAM